MSNNTVIWCNKIRVYYLRVCCSR